MACSIYFKNYMDYLSRLYEREIKDFFEVAKMKMTGTTKESKKFGKPGPGPRVSGWECGSEAQGLP